MNIEGLEAFVRDDLGPEKDWVSPRGYPDSLALAVIDSIQSLGVNYNSVSNVIERYLGYRETAGADATTDGAVDLAASFTELGGALSWANRIGNQNRTSSAPGAPAKAAIIERAARMLVAHGINSASDMLRASAGSDHSVKKEWHALPGQRYGTSWAYLHILLGAEEVKPDRMILGYLDRRLDTEGRLSTRAASEAVRALAQRMGVSERVLEHNLWRFERAERASERARRTGKSDGYGPIGVELVVVDGRGPSSRLGRTRE